ncbi:hypothetical protein BKA62DRAFT_343583 [Auriculariales sp. MPI-PUGE-AT-0066]|nr:hypothetical protein BKA62DRAFT_343583 [Auriculariales sp. MPI-PUGE-AT-0066]
MPSLLPLVRAVGELVLVSTGLNLSIYAYHLVVDPLYGSAAISKYLEHVVVAAAIPALFVTARARWTLSALGCLLFLAPITGYWSAAWTSRLEAEVKGPLACHVLVIAPIVTLALASAKSLRVRPEPLKLLNSYRRTVACCASRREVRVSRGRHTLSTFWSQVPRQLSTCNPRRLDHFHSHCLFLWCLGCFLLNETCSFRDWP